MASETYQIEHPESLKNIDSQLNSENDDLVDTNIDLETNTEVKNTTEIT